PGLGGLLIPVNIYAVVICLMWGLALHFVSDSKKFWSMPIAAGALLFVVSDSILAINRFYYPIPAGGLLVMATYGISQLLICYGVLIYLRKFSRDTVNLAGKLSR